MEYFFNFSQCYLNSFNSLPKIQVIENKSLNQSPENTDDKNFFQGLAFTSVRRNQSISNEDLSRLPDTSIKLSPFKILPWTFSNFNHFELELLSKSITPINKCKYFSLKIGIKGEKDFVFPIKEEIGLMVKVFNQDDQELLKNLKGGNMIKGETINRLSYYTLIRRHFSKFKIQITEVSSHHMKGCFTIKVVPILPETLIKAGWSIDPCVIPGVVVQSKLLKNLKKS